MNTEFNKPIKKELGIPKPIGFVKDVFKLVSGTTIAQVLGILASPLLTRYYGPKAFGILAIFTSVNSILAVILCMRYEFSIVLPKSDEEAANLLALSLGIGVVISIITVPIFGLAGTQIATLLNAPQLSGYMWLIPLALLFGGIGMGHPALNYWTTRTRLFKELSVTRVIGAAAIIVTQLSMGFGGLASAGGLIVGSVVGSIISPLVLAFQIWKTNGAFFLRSIKWSEMLLGLKRHRKFPLFGTWSALLNTISWQLPVFMLSIFFSSTIAGYYSLGFRMLQVPMNLIGDAIGQVFFQRAVEAKIRGVLAPLVEDVFRQLVTISLFPMLILSIIGRDLFVVVFGAEWAEAGFYVQILSIWAFFWFISGPFTNLFAVLEKQEIQLKWNVVTLFTRIASLAIGGFMQNARMAIFLFSFTGVFVYGYKVYINLALSGVSIRRSLLILIKVFLRYFPALAVLLVVALVGVEKWILLTVAFFLLTGHAILFLRGMKNVKLF